MIGHMISVPLIAGAGTDYASAGGGAFTSALGILPSWTYWTLGSAII